MRFSMVDLPLFEVRSKTVGLGLLPLYNSRKIHRALLECTLNLDYESKEDAA